MNKSMELCMHDTKPQLYQIMYIFCKFWPKEILTCITPKLEIGY